MLSVALIWIYMFITILPVGYAVLYIIFDKMNYRNFKGELPITLGNSLLFGIIIVSLYAEFYSLFAGLGGKANVLLILLDFICFFVFRKGIVKLLRNLLGYLNSLSFLKTLFLFCIVLLLLCFTSSGYFFYDTALYHAQAIHWLESYGIAPGIGNIHFRLGYNSSSLCFFALYSMKWLVGQSFHACNGFILFVVIMMAVRRVFLGFTRNKIMSGLCSAGTLVCCSIVIYNAVSPNTDIMPMIMVCWIVMEWTRLVENSENNLCPYALLSIAGLFCFTGKVSMATIVILAIYPAVILCKEKRIKEIVIYISMGIFVLLPFLIRNVIISGWLLYPFAGIDLFNFDWKIKKADLIQDARDAMIYARRVDTPSVCVSKWLPTWWKKSNMVERCWMVAIGISLILWIKQIGTLMICKFKDDYRWILLEFAFFTGVLYWFFTAPSLRYSSSFVVLFPFIILGAISQRAFKLKGEKRLLFEKSLSVALIVFVIMGTIPDKSAFEYTEGYRFNNLKIFKQVDYDSTEVESVTTGNMTIYYPAHGDQAWYYAFPASPDKGTAESIEMRGTTVKDGFRRNN